ncbi:MAG TPA: alpha/beta hydrolase [Pseudomonadales bacterium]|nr:alpha/beta hydrolase [Pseudomonadales bacterium]
MSVEQLTATVIELPDGRYLAFKEFGDPNGVPVFCFHGTPGSRLQIAPTSNRPVPPGIRLIAPDRPGYGLSTYYAGRRLVDWPGDVAALADYLGIDRFAAMGISGGGPHVLVCAHALAARLIGVACVSGVGPLGDPKANENMMFLNRALNVLTQHARPVMVGMMRLQARAMQRDPDAAYDGLVKRLPQADRDVLADPEFRAQMLDDFRRSSPTSALAAAQDFEIFAADWGFSLGDIEIPVHFWQGGVDRNVPAHHAELMASRTPHAVMHRYPDEGHFLVVRRIAEIVATITA